jgi:hypothetical protein
MWGRVTYDDGFGRLRFTNFCHRYNWEVKDKPTGGDALITTEFARYHDHGNDAD